MNAAVTCADKPSEVFALPSQILELVRARNALRDRYKSSGLRFTLDGNLVGDIGEALAHEICGLDLSGRCAEGIDGIAPDGRSVQVKASGTGRGPVFRNTALHADHLLFFHLNYDACTARIVYDGPECLVRALLPKDWEGQRMASISSVQVLARTINNDQRLVKI